MTHTILRLPAVKAGSGLSRSTVYLYIKQGLWPRPVSLGARAVGITPVLLDRGKHLEKSNVDCLLIHSLTDLLDLLEVPR